jgi:anti-sigma B factor antagonist
MDISFDLLWQTPPKDTVVDYDSLIFRFSVDKKLNLDNSNDLWVFFKTIIEGGTKFILIDMNGINFIDSSGIGVMINTAKLIRQSKGDLVLMNVSSDIMHILELVNFQRFIKIFDTVDEVVSHFGNLP